MGKNRDTRNFLAVDPCKKKPKKQFCAWVTPPRLKAGHKADMIYIQTLLYYKTSSARFLAEEKELQQTLDPWNLITLSSSRGTQLIPL